MGKITTTRELQDRIFDLEKKQAGQWILLREEAGVVYENLKPANFIKRTLNDLSSSNGLVENIISPLVGIATGFVSKKMVVGKSTNPFRNIIGSLLQAAVTNIIIKNPEMIKTIGARIVDGFFGKNKENDPN